MKYSKYNIITKNDDLNYVLYNSVTKASIEITEDYKQKIENNIVDGFNEQELSILTKNGFIIEDDRDETKELQYMFNMTYFRQDQLNVAIVPTLKCNFNCPYCFEKVVQDQYENDKYFDVLKKYAKQNFHYHSSVQISLFGGEPLVKEKQVLDFLNFALEDSKKYDYKLRVNITTNGSLLTESNVMEMLKCGLFAMQITLDGGSESHNKTRCFASGKPSFDLLIQKIKMVLKLTENCEDFTMIIRVNLNNNSDDDLNEILNCFTLEERKRLNFMVRVVYNTDKYKKDNSNNLDNLKPFYEVAVNSGAKILKNHFFYQPCEACANNRFFYLMPDLTMWKCINDLNFKKAMFGEILEDGSVKINFENMVDWYKSANCFEDQNCLNCKKLPDCFGGCVLKKVKTGKRNCKTFDMACLPYCMKENG